MRISYGMTTWNDHCIAIALDLAKSIRQTIVGDTEWTEHSSWKKQGEGFGTDEM